MAAKPPMVMFGSFNERMYMTERSQRGKFIPALLSRRNRPPPHRNAGDGLFGRFLDDPGDLQRAVRHALRDPAKASELDAIEANRNPPRGEMPWAEAAQDALDRRISNEPVLVRISAAKRLRDAAEREARRENAAEVAIRPRRRSGQAGGSLCMKTTVENRPETARSDSMLSPHTVQDIRPCPARQALRTRADAATLPDFLPVLSRRRDRQTARGPIDEGAPRPDQSFFAEARSAAYAAVGYAFHTHDLSGLPGVLDTDKSPGEARQGLTGPRRGAPRCSRLGGEFDG